MIPLSLLLNVSHHDCCGMFSTMLVVECFPTRKGFVMVSTELVVEYLPTSLVVDWFPQA